MEDVCKFCGQGGKLMRCSACQAVKYCSREHQVADWSAHKTLCVASRNKAKTTQSSASTVATTVAAKKPETPKTRAPDPRYEDEEEDSESDDSGEEDAEFDDNTEEGRKQKAEFYAALEEHAARKKKLELPLEDRSRCSIHPKGVDHFDANVHALNNMVGSHRLHLPLSEDCELEDFAVLCEDWETVLNDETIGNGLILKAGSRKQLTGGKLGTGLKVKGPMRVGFVVEEGKITDRAVDVTFSTERGWKLDLPQQTQIGEHIRTLEGAYIDRLCVIRGPLIYSDFHIPASGGVHYNGSAFISDGSHPEYPFYREVCIEALANGVSNL